MTKTISSRFITYLALCYTLFLGLQTQAQISINPYSLFYIPVGSFKGISIPNHTKVQIDLHGNAHLENWTLSARIASPIKNSDGKTFPVAKIALKINLIEGAIEGVRPTISSLGSNPNAISMEYSEKNLIQNSPLALITPVGRYNQIVINYDLIIEGGSYLQEFKSWNSYSFNAVISLKNNAGKIIDQKAIANFQIQVMPTDNPPIENTYGIEISAAATNSLLEFRTISDYANGVQVQYDKALKVISSTPYSIQVRAINNQLMASRSSLPISIVQLSLIDSNTFAPLSTLELSNGYQTLYQSSTAAKQARFFTLKYATLANDIRLLEVAPDTYTTTLIYTLTPQ
ncbi:hypothetical protein [Flavobacterium sp. JP2137]|uniref:hypothetical protein n=1 Tax=Flavobacterium sp. JP2137 TaxID=3414510 RepID=UPI003D2FE749